MALFPVSWNIERLTCYSIRYSSKVMFRWRESCYVDERLVSFTTIWGTPTGVQKCWLNVFPPEKPPAPERVHKHPVYERARDAGHPHHPRRPIDERPRGDRECAGAGGAAAEPPGSRRDGVGRHERARGRQPRQRCADKHRVLLRSRRRRAPDQPVWLWGDVAQVRRRSQGGPGSTPFVLGLVQGHRVANWARPGRCRSAGRCAGLDVWPQLGQDDVQAMPCHTTSVCSGQWVPTDVLSILLYSVHSCEAVCATMIHDILGLCIIKRM